MNSHGLSQAGDVPWVRASHSRVAASPAEQDNYKAVMTAVTKQLQGGYNAVTRL